MDKKIKFAVYALIISSFFLLSNNAYIDYEYEQSLIEVNSIRMSGNTLQASRLEVGLNAIKDQNLRSEILDYCSSTVNSKDCLEQRYPMLNNVMFFINLRFVFYTSIALSGLFILSSMIKNNSNQNLISDSKTINESLSELKDLLDEKLITDEEYEIKRKQIVDRL